MRQQRGVVLVGERELDPADQQGKRERLVRVLDVVPAGRHAVRERGDGDLGRLASPVAAVGLHEQGGRQLVSADPQWPGADRVSVAVAFPGALARVTPGGVARRGADLDDRLHPPHGHVRPRRPTGELVDLALKAVSRPCPLPACAKPNRAAHGFHRRLDPCDRPAWRTDPATLVLTPAPSSSCASASGGTRAPDLARLRPGAEVNAGCPGEHIKANRCRGRAARVGGPYRSHSRSGKYGLSRKPSGRRARTLDRRHGKRYFSGSRDAQSGVGCEHGLSVSAERGAGSRARRPPTRTRRKRRIIPTDDPAPSFQ